MTDGGDVLGYVVTNRHTNHAFVLGWYDDAPEAGVLLIGDVVTVFATRARAYAAIRRTRLYEKRKRLDWDTWALRVQRLIAQRRKDNRP